MSPDADLRLDAVQVPFTAEPEDLLPLKMACLSALLDRQLTPDEVLNFCRRADRRNRERFKRALSEYFTVK